MRPRWAWPVVVVLASMGLGAATVALRNWSGTRGNGHGADSTPPRIVVEVVNATASRGMAHRAATMLRDRGFDVVAIETAKDLRDTTLVYDRSGHPDWARRIAGLLKGSGGVKARVEERPDSSRYLDVTVLLGSTWHPPADSLDP